MKGFGLAQWLRSVRPDLRVELVGTAEGAAEKAGDPCDEKPGTMTTYDSQLVVDRIEWFRAHRDASEKPPSEG